MESKPLESLHVLCAFILQPQLKDSLVAYKIPSSEQTSWSGNTVVEHLLNMCEAYPHPPARDGGGGTCSYVYVWYIDICVHVEARC